MNLISDTVTKPTPTMLSYMMAAEVGDDVFRNDPTVNKLESMAAEMFGKEVALFCPSGTMTNQIAIKMHTQALDEMICDHFSHVYQYETSGYAYNSGIGVKLIEGINGKISPSQISESVHPPYDWLPNSKLVVIENSCNKGGGSYYTPTEIAEIRDVCNKHSLKLHLDGARLFNVLVETNESTIAAGQPFDSISICLSKGLGAPVGSLLIGSEEDLRYARRLRKVMGGGMRQAGYLAAAGIFALENNIERLKIDNNRAKLIGSLLEDIDYVKAVKPVETNIVIFSLAQNLSTQQFLNFLSSHGIQSTAFGPQEIRFVFHLDITEKMMDSLINVLRLKSPFNT